MAHKGVRGLGADALIARIAGAQHGVVAVRQLVAAGVARDAVAARARAGRLHRVHQGVYAVGHPALSDEGRWMAAVLACGTGAVLSHRSAASLWRVLDPVAGAVDVTIPSHSGKRPRRGIAIHRSITLTDETTIRNRIPVTGPTRMLDDLRRTCPPELYRRALRKAEYLRLPLGAHEADGTFSELETLLLGLCARHRIPRPRVNARVGPYMVDFLWPRHELIVETDGYQAHSTRSAFENDRARDVELGLRGYVVLRFSYRQVVEDPAAVAVALRRMLAQREAAMAPL